jgi:hypothetical protein
MSGTTKRRLGIAGAIVGALLIGTLIVSGTAFASSPLANRISSMRAHRSLFDDGSGGAPGYGPGMMGGGYGSYGPATSSASPTPGTSEQGTPGTYNGYGPGMMGGYGGYGGMMGGYPGGSTPADPGAQRLSTDQVRTDVLSYLAHYYNNPDLAISEIMEFQYNFYAQVKEQSTGTSAFELLIDPQSGYVWPEFGPNMMWNTKYGMMSGWRGMMGVFGGMMPGYGFGAEPNASMPVTPQQAVQDAQQYLDGQNSGLHAEETPDTFYSYYTLHTLNPDGSIQGMLSVNGYTGQVWYHSWHGQFIGMVGEEQ